MRGGGAIRGSRPGFAAGASLDRTWSRTASLIDRVWTEGESRQVSGHLPLVADLDWPCCGAADPARYEGFSSVPKSVSCERSNVTHTGASLVQ
ncbi:MAG: hypothetical protein OEN55_10045 [Alphaproteobacteria bacterium]|nr:hypothetical protein [Alphaproteobacteria bacterium]